jgi:hypothetical protein
MQYVYFTIIAVVLYFAADRILERIEIRRGERLPYRSLVFFAILLPLAFISFKVIEYLQN